VEVLRADYEEGLALGAPTREKTIEASPPVGAAGANMTPRVDSGCVKEAELQPEDAPGPVTLTPRSPRGPGFDPSQEAILDDVMSIPGSFDVTDLGTGELGLAGIPLSHFGSPTGGK
jgi:hypothetical protein